MKGEKGTCSIGIGSNMIRRTKFDSKTNAQAACDFHIELGFVHPDYVVYQCKECDMWHYGKPEWLKQYSK